MGGQLGLAQTTEPQNRVLGADLAVGDEVGPSSPDPTTFNVSIAHRSGTIRTDAPVPLPLGVMPSDATVERVAVLVDDVTFDTALGGRLSIVWYTEQPPDNHTRLYFGIMDCKSP